MPRFAAALVAAAAFVAPVAIAQQVVWQVRATAPSDLTYGVALLPVSVDRIVAVGYRRHVVLQDTQPWLSRFDPTGQPAGAPDLARTVPTDGNFVRYDQPVAVALANGDAYVAGNLREIFELHSTVYTAWLERHAAAGLVWRRSLAGTAFNALAPAADGVYAAGFAGTAATVVKYDGNGALVWQRSVVPAVGASPGAADFAAAAAFPGGGVVVGGTAAGSALLQRFDEQGNARWPVGTGVGSRVQRVVVDTAGNVFAAGRVSGATRSDLVVTKHDADGRVLWSRTRPGVSGQGCEHVADIALDATGSVIVTGAASTAGGCVAWTTKYATTGSMAWTDEFAVASGPGAYAGAVAIDPTGHAYVGGAAPGYNGGPREARPFVRKLGPRGTALWTAELPGPGSHIWDGTVDVAVAAGGELLALVNDGTVAWLVRLDPGPFERPPPTLVLSVAPAAPVAGEPTQLIALARGSPAPTGAITFRVNDIVACAAVPLHATGTTDVTATCALARGLPPGRSALEIAYSGDANFRAGATSLVLTVADAVARDIPALSPFALAMLAVSLAAAAWRYRRN